MLLFVYGTLKKGHSNHRLIENASYIGEDKTRENYCMINLGHFPATLEREKMSSIKGEMYLANGDLLQTLDKFEGKWFYRKKVLFESGKSAYTYFISPETIKKKYPVIKNGNWTVGNEKQHE